MKWLLVCLILIPIILFAGATLACPPTQADIGFIGGESVPAREAQQHEVETVVLVTLVASILVIPASISACVASKKGRSGFGWFILSLLFGPIILVIVSVVGKGDKHNGV